MAEGIFKRGSAYRVSVYVGRIDGRQVRLTGSAATLAEARELRRRLESQASTERQLGSARSVARLTVSELVELWVTHRSPSWSASTRAVTASNVRLYVSPTIGHVPVAQVTTALVEDLYGQLLHRGIKGGRGPLSPASVQKIHVILRAAFNLAVRREWLDRSPMSRVEPPAPKPRAPKTMPPAAEILAALVAVADDSLRCAFRLSLASGLRRGELLGLRWCDVSFDAGTLRVAQTVVRAGPGRVVIQPGAKSARSLRTIKLDPETLAELQAHGRRSREEALRAGRRVGKTSLIFSLPNGEPWNPDRYSHHWSRHAKRHGLAGFTLHNQRHWMATFLLDSGLSPRQVADRLGHDPLMTARIYAQSSQAGDERAAELIGRALSVHSQSAV